MTQVRISDVTGKTTLDIVSEADAFNEWMFKTIWPFTKGKVLEIGSGIGNVSQFFLEKKVDLLLTDLRDEYCSLLRTKFAHHPHMLGVKKLDLVDPDFEVHHSDTLNSFDTVFALNVVEHIDKDSLAIENAAKLLKKNGHLIILVPSYQFLYNQFDRELGHYRRYNKRNLSQLLSSNGFKIVHKQNFNLIGIPGWFVNGKLLNKQIIPSSQMLLFNRLVPLWKFIDKVTFNKIGLSTIVVGQK